MARWRKAPVRYSPPECIGAKKERRIGAPDPEKISPRWWSGRICTFGWRTARSRGSRTGFSRRAENHAYAVSLSFFAYNFITPHGTRTKANGGTKTTPAMAAGVTERVWKVEEILALMDPARETVT